MKLLALTSPSPALPQPMLIDELYELVVGLLENFEQEGEALNGSLREQQGLGKFCYFY